MTTAQIKHWFTTQHSVTETTIRESRKSLNLATAAKLRPLRTISQTAFAKLMGVERAILNHLEKANRVNWRVKYVDAYLRAAKEQTAGGRKS